MPKWIWSFLSCRWIQTPKTIRFSCRSPGQEWEIRVQQYEDEDDGEEPSLWTRVRSLLLTLILQLYHRTMKVREQLQRAVRTLGGAAEQVRPEALPQTQNLTGNYSRVPGETESRVQILKTTTLASWGGQFMSSLIQLCSDETCDESMLNLQIKTGKTHRIKQKQFIKRLKPLNIKKILFRSDLTPQGAFKLCH